MRPPLILCVDDDPAMCELYVLMLDQYGFETITAGDGFEAMQTFQFNSAIDAVILDYQMPGMDGLELAFALKSRDPDLPILMISSQHPEMDEFSLCIDAAMSKGMPIRDIVGQLEILLAKKETCATGTLPC